MRENDLRHVWVCYECQQCFVFEMDMQDHTRLTGHRELQEYEITEVMDGFGGEDKVQQDERSRW